MTLKRKTTLAFFANAVGFSLIAYSYGFYYVKIFLDFYHIEEEWFQISQVCILVFNLVSDPLFAFIQEKDTIFTRTRREAILYSSPFLAAAYLIPWFQWGDSPMVVGMHLIIGLLCWDGLLTYVMFAQGSLFTEISNCNADRLKLIRVSNIGHLIGSSSIIFLEFVSDNLKNMFHFQVGTVLIAFLAMLCYKYTGTHAHTQYDQSTYETNNAKPKSFSISTIQSEDGTFWKIWWQIFKQKDFVMFLIINFLQEFHRTFLCNFMVVVGDQLVPEVMVPTWVKSVFYGSTRVLPMVFVVAFTPLVAKIGYFHALRASFVWKIFGGTIMYFIGHTNPWILMSFLILDSIFATAAHSLFNLPVSDICDEDMRRNQRSHPRSSIVYGIVALCHKPALSLLPMFAVAILNDYGYAKLAKHELQGAQLELLLDIMFNMVCFLPIVLGTLQFIAWNFYSIRKNGINDTKLIGGPVNKC